MEEQLKKTAEDLIIECLGTSLEIDKAIKHLDNLKGILDEFQASIDEIRDRIKEDLCQL